MAPNLIMYCLEKITDYPDFERFCNSLMALHRYPDIEPLGGSGDSGRDAVFYSREIGLTVIFAYSVNKDWKRKLFHDCESIRRNGHTFDTLVFMCTSKISASSRDAVKRDVEEKYGWELDLYDRERIYLLILQHQDIIEQHSWLFHFSHQARAKDSYISIRLDDIELRISPDINLGSVLREIDEYRSDVTTGIILKNDIKDSDNAVESGFKVMLRETALSIPMLIERYELPSRLKELLDVAENHDDRINMFWFINNLNIDSNHSMTMMVREILEGMATEDKELGNYLAIIDALEDEHPLQALKLLEDYSVEDNPILLQLRAQAYLHEGEKHDALLDMERASVMLNIPEMYQRTADLAYSIGAFHIAVEQTNCMLKLFPDNIQAHRNLVSLYLLKLEDFGKAVEELYIIHEAQPEDQIVTLSLANTLILLNRTDESLAIFHALCALQEPMKQAVLCRAQLLEGLGQLQEAFFSLTPFREVYLDDPEYLLVLMGIAFTAGEEQVAHSTMLQLERLRKGGAELKGKFERVHVSDGMEIFSERHKRVQERDSILLNGAIRGQIPWVMADRLAGVPVARGWMLRTKPKDWIPELPEDHARFVLYTTNALHVSRTHSGKSLLRPLETADSYDTIVLDISSIITLRKLGLLNFVADQLGTILIPEAYLTLVLDDSRKMILNQRSKLDALNQMKEIIDNGRITVGGANDETTPVVDEYGQSEKHLYRLIDLVQPMYASGVVPDRQFDFVHSVGTGKSGVDEEHPVLQRSQSILVAVETLETLHNLRLLSTATEYFSIHISTDSATYVRRSLEEIRSLKEIQKWHLDLWSFIRDDPRFVLVPHSVPEDMKREDDGPSDYIAFIGYFIATEKKLPLLIDDRVIQRLALDENPDRPGAAFGTDVLLRNMVVQGRLDSRRAADAILQLIRWRYRFLLPDAEFFLTLAARYREHPPGQALRDVSSYVHDCMRDPGLFAGPEKTDLGEPMAMRLYLTWITVVAEFLVGVWDNTEFPIESARVLTNWAVQELLPSTPQVMNGEGRRRLGALTAKALLSHVLIKSSTSAEPNRMIEMMKLLQEELQFSDEEYNTLVTEILDDSRRQSS